MAVLMMEGFDYYASVAGLLSGRWVSSVSGDIAFGSGQDGEGQGLQIANTGTQNWIYHLLDSVHEFWFGLAFKIGTFSAGDHSIVYFPNATFTDFDCSFCFDGAGRIEARKGTESGTLLGIGSDVMVATEWNIIEGHVVISPGGGTMQVWLNGAEQFNLTGINNSNSGDTACAGIWFYGANTGGTTKEYDNVYVTDDNSPNEGRVGPAKVLWMAPSDPGPSDPWTPNTGTTDSAVQSDDGDTSYIEESGSDLAQTYDLPTWATGTPIAVEVVGLVKKMDAPAKRIHLTWRPDEGFDEEFSDHFVTTSYAYYSDILNVEPDTSLAWNAARINHGWPGITLPAGDGMGIDFNAMDVRCSQLAVQVLFQEAGGGGGIGQRTIVVVMG